MDNLLHPSLVIAAVAAIGSLSLVAQSAAESRLLQLPAVIRAQANDASGAVELWAMGRDYKASFHDGFHMVLPVGAQAPRAPVFAWTTTSVTAGGVDRMLERAAAHVVGTQRCEYDLGAVIEAYEVRPDGVEQTFVLRQPVAGDLVVRGRFGGDFAGRPAAPMHGPLSLEARTGLRSLTYGAATAIDANGATVPLTTAVVGDAIELRVPGSWLESAAYPVVIDPLLSPVQVIGPWLPVIAMDIEHDDRNSAFNVCFAYEVAYSSTDHDIRFVLAHDNFTSPAVVFERMSYANETGPRATFVNAPNKWAFAYTVETSQEGGRWVRHDGADSAYDGQTASSVVTAQAGGRQRNMVLGGNRSFASTGTKALLVREWESSTSTGNTSQTELWGSLLDLATGNEGGTFRIAGGGTTFPTDAEAPAVSRDCQDGSWVVAYQNWSILAGKWAVQVRRVASNGVPVNGVLSTDLVAQPQHAIAPKVDGANGRYLVAFGIVDTASNPGAIAGSTAQSLRAMRFDWDEAAAQGTAQPSHSIAAGLFGRTWRLGGLSHDTTTRSHWAVTCTTLTGATTSVKVLGYQGLMAHSDVIPNVGVAPSAVTFDDDHARFEIAWGDAAAEATGIEWEYPTLHAPALYGTACVPATIGYLGDFRIGSEFPSLRLANAPAYGVALLMLSTQGVNLDMTGLGYPGCALLVDPSPGAWLGALAVVALGNGTAAVPIPLPEGLAPGDLFAQWAILDAALPNGIGSTRGLRVELR